MTDMQGEILGKLPWPISQPHVLSCENSKLILSCVLGTEPTLVQFWLVRSKYLVRNVMPFEEQSDSEDVAFPSLELSYPSQLQADVVKSGMTVSSEFEYILRLHENLETREARKRRIAFYLSPFNECYEAFFTAVCRRRKLDISVFQDGHYFFDEFLPKWVKECSKWFPLSELTPGFCTSIVREWRLLCHKIGPSFFGNNAKPEDSCDSMEVLDAEDLSKHMRQQSTVLFEKIKRITETFEDLWLREGVNEQAIKEHANHLAVGDAPEFSGETSDSQTAQQGTTSKKAPKTGRPPGAKLSKHERDCIEMHKNEEMPAKIDAIMLMRNNAKRNDGREWDYGTAALVIKAHKERERRKRERKRTT